MSRFLSIATALGEAAAIHGRQPTARQFALIEDALREQIVIDFDTGLAGICYSNGFVVDPATFVANELMHPGIESRSTSRTTSSATPGF